MKKILSIALIGAGLLTMASCSDSDFDERYADPSKTATVGVPQVFTGIMQAGNTWMNPVYYRYYCQTTTSGTFSGVVGNANDKGRYLGTAQSRINDRWQNFYNMLTQYRILENTYNSLAEEQQVSNKVFLLLGRTMVEAQLHEILSLFGDVPYTGAGTLSTSTYDAAKAAAVYDDDVTLYKQILVDLKEVGDYLSTTSLNAAATTALKTQDYTTAGGDITVWQKYANSLRLRIALHLATNGDATTEARAAIKEIVENPSKYPVVDSNAENMGVNGDTETDFFNYGKGISQAFNGAWCQVSQTFLDALNVPATGIVNADTDPRIDAMLDPNPDNQYVAYDVTKTSSELSDEADAKRQEYITRGISSSNYWAKIDTIAFNGWTQYQGNTNLNGIWISAAEVSLAKAEAYLMGYGVGADAAKAKEAFIKGVEQSSEYYWNMKTGSSLAKDGNDSYAGYRALVVPTAADFTAYAEKAWKGTQECINTQQWLNHSFMNFLEAWNVIRRTGYPVVKFATDTQESDYPTPPYRLPYPSDEINYNADNYATAKANNYGSDQTGFYTKLFWQKSGYYTLVN